MNELECVIRGQRVPVAVSFYPDGAPLMQAPSAFPDALLFRPTSMAALFAGLFWVDAIAARFGAVPPLVFPNVFGARQDRLNDEGDYLFTAKSVAQAINARQFPRVAVLDPHSDVIPALLDRCHVAHAEIGGRAYDGVIAPDAGAARRAGRIARGLGVGVVHAWKSRDVRTGAIRGFGIEPIAPGHYLVADDLCDAGGTFLGLADCLDAAGATADLYVTHGLFTKGTAALLARYRVVLCTDSTVGEKPGVVVIPRCDSLLSLVSTL